MSPLTRLFCSSQNPYLASPILVCILWIFFMLRLVSCDWIVLWLWFWWRRAIHAIVIFCSIPPRPCLEVLSLPSPQSSDNHISFGFRQTNLFTSEGSRPRPFIYKAYSRQQTFGRGIRNYDWSFPRRYWRASLRPGGGTLQLAMINGYLVIFLRFAILLYGSRQRVC